MKGRRAGGSTSTNEYDNGDTVTYADGRSCTRRPTTWATKRTTGTRVPEVQEPGNDSDGQGQVQPREQSVVQVLGNGPGGRSICSKGLWTNGATCGYIMPHEERRGPMPHQGGWQVQLHPYGPGPGDDDHVGDVERTSLALAALRGWQAASLDIKTAFLNAPLRTLQESSRQKVLALEDAHGRLHENEGGDGGGHTKVKKMKSRRSTRRT